MSDVDEALDRVRAYLAGEDAFYDDGDDECLPEEVVDRAGGDGDPLLRSDLRTLAADRDAAGVEARIGWDRIPTEDVCACSTPGETHSRRLHPPALSPPDEAAAVGTTGDGEGRNGDSGASTGVLSELQSRNVPEGVRPLEGLSAPRTDAKPCSTPGPHDPHYWHSGMTRGIPGPIALTTHICPGIAASPEETA